jgi:hypothetical protein
VPRLRSSLIAFVAATVTILAAAAAGASAATKTTYDLSLGDSLAQSYQSIGGRRCSDRIPHGAGAGLPWRTAELFVADVILDRDPLCGYDLSTARLSGDLPLRPFSRGYPPVPIARASRAPDARQAVYMLSRRFAAFVVVGADGRLEVPLVAGVAAPKAGSGAYDLVLVVKRGGRRVDRASRVRIVEKKGS